MIIVAAAITAAPGKRDAFVQAAQPCIAATRAEQGCLYYALYAATEHPDKLLYFEKWTSREALKAHSESAHMADFASVKKRDGLQNGDADVQIFDVAE